MLPNSLYRFIRTGIVHPYAAYQTYKAYMYKDWPKLEFWLVYWMVMAAYMAVELLTDIFISWMPFYSAAKLGVLIWLTTVRTQGSTLVFREIIHPQLAANETKIDQTLAVLGAHAKTKLRNFGINAVILAENLIGIAVTKGYDIMQSYMTQRSYQDQRTKIATFTNQDYKDRPLPPVQDAVAQGSATQLQLKRFEFFDSRKYLCPQSQMPMPMPQLPSPPCTPCPDHYAQDQYTVSQKPHFAPPVESRSREYILERTNLREEDYRRKQAYQRVRKTSDTGNERQYLRASNLVPPRPYSAAAAPRSY